MSILQEIDSDDEAMSQDFPVALLPQVTDDDIGRLQAAKDVLSSPLMQMAGDLKRRRAASKTHDKLKGRVVCAALQWPHIEAGAALETWLFNNYRREVVNVSMCEDAN